MRIRHWTAWVLAALSGACAAAPAPRAPTRTAPAPRASSRARRRAQPLPPLTSEERALSGELARDVHELAGKIGERNVDKKWELASAADYLAGAFEQAGYTVNRLGFAMDGVAPMNLEVTVRGGRRGDQVVVVGAHYDSASGSPGANDDASGAAAVLALARAFRHATPSRTLRFVEFVNAEAPFFKTDNMGSLHYAKSAAARGDHVVAMLSIESIGCFSDAPDSQHAPPTLALAYPTTGDFIAFLSRTDFARLTDAALDAFRSRASIPSAGTTVAENTPGIAWSDSWAFWQVGFPALMVTDTAGLRDPGYHTAADTPDKLDYDRMARVVQGLQAVIDRLALVPDRRRSARQSSQLAPG